MCRRGVDFESIHLSLCVQLFKKSFLRQITLTSLNLLFLLKFCWNLRSSRTLQRWIVLSPASLLFCFDSDSFNCCITIILVIILVRVSEWLFVLNFSSDVIIFIGDLCLCINECLSIWFPLGCCFILKILNNDWLFSFTKLPFSDLKWGIPLFRSFRSNLNFIGTVFIFALYRLKLTTPRAFVLLELNTKWWLVRFLWSLPKRIFIVSNVFRSTFCHRTLNCSNAEFRI